MAIYSVNQYIGYIYKYQNMINGKIAQYILDNISQKSSRAGLEKGLIRHCKNKSKKNQYYGFIWKYKADC